MRKGGIHLHMAKKSSCHDEEDAQSDATELEENIKDTASGSSQIAF